MANDHAETLRFTLGMKLRKLRRERKLNLSTLAEKSGIAVSYLSEIEKGKKFPKPEKLLELASALGVSYDDLVSQQLDGSLSDVRSVLNSDWFRAFPFHLFGLDTEDVFSLVTRDPDRAGAFLRTFLDIGLTYDLDVEQFLLAALRSYQQLSHNHFAELELAASTFRRSARLPSTSPPDPTALARLLVSRWGYEIDTETLERHAELGSLRTLYVPPDSAGGKPLLLINSRLLPSQRAYVLAREIGFRHLGIEERPVTSSWITVDSFAQVFNNFRASYFAGALLIDGERLRRDLERWFAERRFDASDLLRLLARYKATPETLFHRLTEVLPHHFGLEELFFLRFTTRASATGAGGATSPQLTKLLNLSHVAVPHGLGLNETYCRRWPALRLLAPARAERGSTLIEASYLRFQGRHGAPDRGPERPEFLVFTASRPLALDTSSRSAVALGLVADGVLAAKLRFAADPAIPRLEVDLTCERCPLSEKACRERAAPPRLFRERQTQTRRVAAVAELSAQRRRAAPPTPHQ